MQEGEKVATAGVAANLAEPLLYEPLYARPRPTLLLTRLTFFFFLLCLFSTAQDLIWPVNLWRLPDFPLTSLFLCAQGLSFMAPKVTFAGYAINCISSGAFLMSPSRTWKFLRRSLIWLIVTLIAQELIGFAVDAMHQLGWNHGADLYVPYHVFAQGILGLFPGLISESFLKIGPPLSVFAAMRAARPSARESLRRLQYLVCAALAAPVVAGFNFYLSGQTAVVGFDRLSYVLKGRFFFDRLGALGDTLDYPISTWVDVLVASAAIVAIITRLRRRRPLLIMLGLMILLLAGRNGLLSVAVLAETLGHASGRFGVKGKSFETLQWLSDFADSAFRSAGPYVAAFLILGADFELFPRGYRIALIRARRVQVTNAPVAPDATSPATGDGLTTH